MRILILTISYAPNVGGVETHLLDWTRWLGGKPDLEVDVLTYQPITTRARGAPVEKQGNVTLFRVPWIGHNWFHHLESKPLLQFLYLAPRLLMAGLWHLFRRKKYDVIHAQGLVAIWVAGWLKRVYGVPVLGSLHTVYVFPAGSPTGRRIGNVLRGADRVLSCAQTGVDQALAFGLPSERCGRFTYWVDQELYSPGSRETARHELGWEADAFVGLFVGRFIEVKGVEVILSLARRHPEILLVMAGDGPMEEAIRATAKELSNLRLVGCVDGPMLARLYRAADLLLVPSRFTEGIPRVCCEALSCGLPVLASRRGGSPEAIVEGVGLLSEPTEEAFSEAILRWRARGDRREDVGRVCRRHAEERFSSKNAHAMERALRRTAGCVAIE